MPDQGSMIFSDLLVLFPINSLFFILLFFLFFLCCYLNYPEYLDILIPYHTCPEICMSILLPFHNMYQYTWLSDKKVVADQMPHSEGKMDMVTF